MFKSITRPAFYNGVIEFIHTPEPLPSILIIIYSSWILYIVPGFLRNMMTNSTVESGNGQKSRPGNNSTQGSIGRDDALSGQMYQGP